MKHSALILDQQKISFDNDNEISEAQPNTATSYQENLFNFRRGLSNDENARGNRRLSKWTG